MKMNTTSADYWDLFPIMAVKDGVILSRRGDLTLGWEMTLPECFSLERDTVEAQNGKWEEALRLLPPWMLVHRQDIYTRKRYIPEEGRSFLGRCYENHFSGRPYLRHRQYIWLTLSSKSSALAPTADCGIYGMKKTAVLPKEEDLDRLRSAAASFIGKLTESSSPKARPLEDEEIISIMEEYRRLWKKDSLPADIRMEPSQVEMDGTRLWAYVLSEAKDLPRQCPSSRPAETLSGPGYRLYTSTAAAAGPLLDCEHMVNTYYLTVHQESALSEVDARRRKMTSMSRRSTGNRINAAELEEFEESVQRDGSLLIRAHLNIMVWDTLEEASHLKAKVSSALSSMNINAVLDTFDTPVLWYSALPGAGCELGKENFLLSELEGAMCLNLHEGYSRGIPGGAVKLCDRTRHIPIRLDIHRAASEMGLITNYNAFILGESGAGKSFFTNHLARCSYDNGETVFIVDMGGSYEGLCAVINDETGGRDGHYHRWSREETMSFDGFWDFDDWTDASGSINQDCDGLNFITGFLQTVAVPDGGWTPRGKDILQQMIRDFTVEMKRRSVKPVLDDLNAFLGRISRRIREDRPGEEYLVNGVKVTPSVLDLDGILFSLGKYCQGGPYAYLLNDRHPKDIISSRFTVFDMTTIQDIRDREFRSAIILCIMNSFNAKMHRTRGFKTLIIDEAWMAVANETMAPFLNNLWKTSRKYSTSAVVVTQQLSDIMKSPVVRDTILANSSVRAILKDQEQSTIGDLAELLGLSAQQQAQVLSMNRGKDPSLRYMEVYLSIGSRLSGIWGTEVSPQEAVAYQSKIEEKQPFLALAREKGAVAAIREITKMP